MDIDFAFICDYAESVAKINALGIGFDTIFAPKLPARRPHFHVVAQIRASITEAGTKDMSVYVINADGVDVVDPIRGKIEIPKPRLGATETTARINIAFHNVQFKDYGSYSVRITIQETEMVSIPLRVSEPPKTA